jgi:cell division transport system permease protein
MASGWLIQLAAVGSIAVGLLLVGAAALGVVNLERLTSRWEGGLPVTVYIRPNAPEEQVVRLAQTMESHALVRAIERVSPATAHKRLRASLGAQSQLLEGLEPDFLPPSLELTLERASAHDLRALLGLLASSPVVEEVDHMGPWVSRLTSLVTLIRVVALALVLLVCLACLYIVSTTIRLSVHSRREEIAILKLVGATDRYVRGPFLVEGTLQGLIGALIAAALLYALFRVAGLHLEELLRAALDHGTLIFVTAPQLAAGIGASALIGLLGSRAALGRYVEG